MEEGNKRPRRRSPESRLADLDARIFGTPGTPQLGSSPGSKGGRRRRIALALGSVAALVLLAIPATSFADAPNGCDFTITVNKVVTDGCLPPVSPSTFAGSDGNLLDGYKLGGDGTTDWATTNATVNVGIDQPSGGGDNAFGQGTKEDDPAVTIVSGSIPPQKSDLTRFYEASETIGSGSAAQVFLYLSWERTNTLGTANMDFEINQKITCVGTESPGTGGCTTGHPLSGTDTGKVTLNRTAGDLLVTYDFTNGGGRPVLGLNTWLTSATVPTVPNFSTNVCLSSNTFPCWGDHIDLNALDANGNPVISEGATNNKGAVTDPIQPSSANACVGTDGTVGKCEASRFGEAAINLTGAGVFSSTECKAFGSVFLKSRSSSSFPAEVKDFVAPKPVTISNCGVIRTVKVVDGSDTTPATSFPFTVNGPAQTTLPDNFQLTNGGQHDTTVLAGDSYTDSETVPTNWSLVSASCVNGSGQPTGTLSGSTISGISVAADETVTCTFHDQLQLGALMIEKRSTKTDSSGNHPLVSHAGAVFSYDGHSVTDNGTGDENSAIGLVCVSGLSPGSYSVTETTAPSGYAKDTSTQPAVVVTGTNCTTNLPAVTDRAVFLDPPLYSLQVNFKDGGSGETSATISCPALDPADSTTPPSGWDMSSTYNNRNAPATITCTITVDP
jgi:hypothetical protein